jgi:hypothetical protein
VEQEDWVLWLDNPVTRQLLAMLQHLSWEVEQEEVARFKNGVGLDDAPHIEQVRRAKALGAHEVYQYLLTMSEEDLNETLDGVHT